MLRWHGGDAYVEFGAGDAQYLLLRVPVAEGAEPASLAPYLVLNGRIVPPIDIGACGLIIEKLGRSGAGGSADCSDASRALLTKLRFTAN